MSEPHRTLGHPHLHLGEAESTNAIARAQAADGAPHGAVVSTDLQTAGRGRQGRAWSGVPGAIALSVILRAHVDGLLAMRAGLAVARLAGPSAQIKWPNDVLIDGRKVAGTLVEQSGAAAVLGIGINAAIDPDALPPEVAQRAGTLGRDPAELPALRARLLEELEQTISAPSAEILAAIGARDALAGRPVRWQHGEGVAAGIAADGRLRVRTLAGAEQLLDGGEVHLL